MPFKLNLGEKGKTYKLESSSEAFIGKKIGDTISGKEIASEVDDFEFEITGFSDKSGFPGIKGVEGMGLKKRLLKYGLGMRKRPRREAKKPRADFKPKGLRLRKTVHADYIGEDIIQINLKISKQGSKPLAEIYKKEEPKEKSGEEKQSS